MFSLGSPSFRNTEQINIWRSNTNPSTSFESRFMKLFLESVCGAQAVILALSINMSIFQCLSPQRDFNLQSSGQADCSTAWKHQYISHSRFRLCLIASNYPLEIFAYVIYVHRTSAHWVSVQLFAAVARTDLRKVFSSLNIPLGDSGCLLADCCWRSSWSSGGYSRSV